MMGVDTKSMLTRTPCLPPSLLLLTLHLASSLPLSFSYADLWLFSGDWKAHYRQSSLKACAPVLVCVRKCVCWCSLHKPVTTTHNHFTMLYLNQSIHLFIFDHYKFMLFLLLYLRYLRYDQCGILRHILTPTFAGDVRVHNVLRVEVVFGSPMVSFLPLESPPFFLLSSLHLTLLSFVLLNHLTHPHWSRLKNRSILIIPQHPSIWSNFKSLNFISPLKVELNTTSMTRQQSRQAWLGLKQNLIVQNC